MKAVMKTVPKMQTKFANLKGDKNMNAKFEMICKMTQKHLKEYVATELKRTYTDVTVGDGFVFAKGTFPVLLVAHLDTVHKKLPSLIAYDAERDALFCEEGIGGDDRCGVYMIFEIIKRYNCSVLFCEDEEVGGVGAEKFIETDLAKELQFNYAIELDRRGSNDAVFYDCENDDFEEFITKDFYKTAWGSFSDISVVAPFLKCAAVNLSCGYYNAHNPNEYVVLHEMEKSIEEVCKILERTTEKDKFEYIEAKYNGYYSGWWNRYSSSSSTKGNSYGHNYSWYDEYDDGLFEVYYLIEYLNRKDRMDWYETYALSEAEAVGKFLMENPNLCYSDIITVMVDNAK